MLCQKTFCVKLTMSARRRHPVSEFINTWTPSSDGLNKETLIRFVILNVFYYYVITKNGVLNMNKQHKKLNMSSFQICESQATKKKTVLQLQVYASHSTPPLSIAL